jgi:hypothetical protein
MILKSVEERNLLDYQTLLMKHRISCGVAAVLVLIARDH